MLDFNSIQHLIAATTPALPPEAWWLAVLILLILGIAALIDSVSSIVPDPLIFIGLLVTVATQGFAVDWPFAATQLSYALVSAIVIWAVNQCWYRIFKHDAIGMGDAKWTMLAVACFGVIPGILAWGVGACLAVVWLGLLRLARRSITHIYFAPFLWIGLCAGLIWIQMRDSGFNVTQVF